jgi:hypothetical protein
LLKQALRADDHAELLKYLYNRDEKVWVCFRLCAMLCQILCCCLSSHVILWKNFTLKFLVNWMMLKVCVILLDSWVCCDFSRRMFHFLYHRDSLRYN